ncbi:hypothetical protein BGX28_001072 [Mortierella sp. GBA30]|nr:hypothetical protein BGX28_001072 [Mortierella sp. GBA30]
MTKSVKFYKFLYMDILGFRELMVTEQYAMWWKYGAGAIGISPGGTNVAHYKFNPGFHHMALNLDSRKEVDDAHQKLQEFYAANTEEQLGEILDAPAEYEYMPGYYAPMRHTGAINHIALSASDYDKSRRFYNFLLKDLMGYKRILEEPYCTTWALKTGETISVSLGNQTPHHKYNPGLHHLAFSTATHGLVDEFYDKIIEFQKAQKDMTASKILDKPALYPEYGEGYYGRVRK